MYDRADFYINGSALRSPFSDAIEERHDGHSRIVAALETGDAEAARQAAGVVGVKASPSGEISMSSNSPCSSIQASSCAGRPELQQEAVRPAAAGWPSCGHLGLDRPGDIRGDGAAGAPVE